MSVKQFNHEWKPSANTTTNNAMHYVIQVPYERVDCIYNIDLESSSILCKSYKLFGTEALNF